jgi:hypothetical protein
MCLALFFQDSSTLRAIGAAARYLHHSFSRTWLPGLPVSYSLAIG